MAKIMFKSTTPKNCKSCGINFYHAENNLCGWCYDKKERKKDSGNIGIGTGNARLIAWGLVVFMLVVLLMSDAVLKGTETKYKLLVIENNSKQ